MNRRFARLPFILASLVVLAGADSLAERSTVPKTARVPEPKDFDRLDGRGPSGKKIDVIEWEGNLEIHSYPKGALRSLGMKIDRESKKTKNAVMVIEYGFHGVPYTMIRRAMMTIKMPDAFHAYRDPSAEGYDKVIISGNQQVGLPTYALAPAPAQLFPDHSPELEAPGTPTAAETRKLADEPAKTYPRKHGPEAREPASPGIQFRRADEVQQDETGTVRRRGKAAPESESEEESRIPNFSF